MAVRWWAAVAGLGPSGGSPSERTTPPRSMGGRTLRSDGGPPAGRPPQSSPPPRRRVPHGGRALAARGGLPGAAPPPPLLPRRFPPRVEGAGGDGGGRVEQGPAGFDRPHRRLGAGSSLKLLHQPVALRPGEPAVVAGDGKARPFGEVVGQPLPPTGEVGED